MEFSLDLAVGDNTSAAVGLLYLFPMGKGFKYVTEVGGDAIKGGSKAKSLYKVATKEISKLNKYGIDVSKLKFTNTAQNHFNDVYKADKIGKDGFKTKFYKGESTKPYIEKGTTLLIEEITKTKSPIPDPGEIVNGLRWDVPGRFAGEKSVWELVINKDNNTIVHLLFN
ncbi:hypothetical protein [Clostridium sporogenes]|uniref:hypothetical protein n=1 Tax=Clostridium sporogenes TaxID=1509 RepID=UPI002237A057|nr:hypothetical protein [Clostridium sporogenes]MCW6076140.1 hypothetical protein [Clostridium sporogenes]MCW6111071.1 hypothetical protein [Clostridium sporogenes]